LETSKKHMMECDRAASCSIRHHRIVVAVSECARFGTEPFRVWNG
jgi:hypothetical protein